jgi:uncharacterized protein (TIGR03067 family)
MRRVIPLACALLAASGMTSLRADDAQKDLQRLQGVWSVVECVGDGRPLTKKLRDQMKIAFKGKKIIVGGGGDIFKGNFTFKIDPSKKPKAIDIIALDGPLKGKAVQAIYELTGDGLKLCLPIREGKNRPTEFESPEGLGYGLFILVRNKQ